MPAEVLEVVEAFQKGRLGASVRDLELCTLTARGVHTKLTASGFRHQLRPIVAERTSRGLPRWLRLDGTSTGNEADPLRVLVHDYVHDDAGLVRVYPSGDPSGREAPKDGPHAVKAVLFPFSPARKGEPCTLYDIAFRVSEGGEVISKSRRAHHGALFDPTDVFMSWVYAGLHLEEAAFIPLLPEGTSGLFPEGATRGPAGEWGR